MISILIPIYNQDVNNLVNDLICQLDESKINYEIIAIDDDSEVNYKTLNNKLSEKQNVRYYRLEKNIGRSKIRNLLASKAIYAHLIFLDCDSQISSNNNYIQNYLKVINDNPVVYGGTSYGNKKPTKNYLLHWKYGKTIESKIALYRNQNTYASFRTNNFAIHKFLFDKTAFDESISNYGYEDNIFAKDLSNIGIKILHIDNTVVHSGLIENENYLTRTEESIKNLIRLYKVKKITSTKLIETYNRLHYLGMVSFLNLFNPLLKEYIKKLIYKYPENMKLFQLWKLLAFIDEIKKPA